MPGSKKVNGILEIECFYGKTSNRNFCIVQILLNTNNMKGNCEVLELLVAVKKIQSING